MKQIAKWLGAVLTYSKVDSVVPVRIFNTYIFAARAAGAAAGCPAGAEQLNGAVFGCLKSWISFCDIKAEHLASSPLFTGAFDALGHGPLFEHACDVIVEALRRFDCRLPENGVLVAAIAPRVMALEARFAAATASEDDDEAMGLCRIFCEMGEAYMPMIASERDCNQLAIVSVMIKCTEYPARRVAAAPLRFWYHLARAVGRLADGDPARASLVAKFRDAYASLARLWRVSGAFLARLSRVSSWSLARLGRDSVAALARRWHDSGATLARLGAWAGLESEEQEEIVASVGIKASVALLDLLAWLLERDPRRRLQWNRITLFVEPALVVGPEVATDLANRLAPATRRLGLEKVVLRLNLLDPEHPEKAAEEKASTTAPNAEATPAEAAKRALTVSSALMRVHTCSNFDCDIMRLRPWLPAKVYPQHTPIGQKKDSKVPRRMAVHEGWPYAGIEMFVAGQLTLSE